jgi:hypothetical protein
MKSSLMNARTSPRLPLSGVSLLLAAALTLASGCASRAPAPAPGSAGVAVAAPESEPNTPLAALPGVFGGRFAPPAYATRVLEGERAEMLNTALATVDALGYRVTRFDGARGRIEAARAPESSFEGRSQVTLELSVQTLAPGQVSVAVVLRESFEADGQGGAAMVRDRAAYDVIFERLTPPPAP